MTGEEMERAIEFILQSQAALEARMGRVEEQIEKTQRQVEETQQQLAETNRVVQIHADTQSQFIQVVTTALDDLTKRQSRTDETLKLFIESQKRINAALVEAQQRGAEEQRRGAEEQRRIMEALAEGQRRTDDRVDRLAETVERFIREGRNGRG